MPMMYRAGGIMPSQMEWFTQKCRARGVGRVVESGRRYGYSTEFLASQNFGVIESVELKPDKDTDDRLRRLFPNIVLHAGDGRELLPMLAGRSTDTTAALIDGPKGADAIELAVRLSGCCVFVGIHDIGQSVGLRDVLRERFWGVAYSDEYDESDAGIELNRGTFEGTYGSSVELAHSCTMAIVYKAK